MTISLAMIVKNEEKFIQRCLDSVCDLVDEMVIVDTGSTDNTINIIKSNYPKVQLFTFKWQDDFSTARNFALDSCNGDYILVLDADEYVIEGSKQDLEYIIKDKIIGQLRINSHFVRDNQVFHTTSYVSRFFPRFVKYTGTIHEQLVSDLPRVKMSFSVGHDGYFNTNKGKRNIPLLFNEVNKNPNDPYYLFQLGKELRINRQYEEAFNYLFKSYELSNGNSYYYGELVIDLINCGKEIGRQEILGVINKNEMILEMVSDFHFAKGLFYLDYCLKFPNNSISYINLIEDSFLKCLDLHSNRRREYVEGTSSFLAAYNLGVFYEVTGNIKKAIHYYHISSRDGYTLAHNRIQKLL